MYAHVPSVATYPVYLGDLDKVLAPFVTDAIADDELDRKLRRFWIGIDRMQLRGGAEVNKSGFAVRHIAEVLADHLK